MTREDSYASARAALDDGDLAAAAVRIDALLAARPEDPEALHLQGRLLLGQGRPRAAVAVLERAVDARPSDVASLTDLGRACNNAGRLDAARRVFERATELAPRDADARAFLGHALRALGRMEESAAAFDVALSLDADHLRALKGLGSVRLARGDAAGAAEVLAQALRRDPQDARAAAHLGAALHRTGDPEGAERAYRRALELDPRQAEAWLNLGITLQDTGRLPAAIEAYKEATRLTPEHLIALNRLADALLAARQAGEALTATERCLDADPGNPAALAARALALGELGREREASSLLDWERLVRGVDLALPEGLTPADFNEALRAHVLAHPTLSYEPEGHATRGGRHTRDLLAGDKGPVALLEAAVLAAVPEYLRRIGPAPGHPFPGPVPATPRLAMWAVVMGPEGHQLPHIHPVAWLSGVYYVDLPGTLGVDEADPAGWIEFGRPPDDIPLRHPPSYCLRRPVEGRMFLFPSYFYHRTIPFPGPAPRICIAFDVLRQGRAGP